MDRSKWEYKKLGEVCEVLDKLRKPVTKSDRVTGQYPYYGATGIQDYVADYIFDGRYLLLGEDGAKWGANDNSAFIIEGKSWVNNHAHVLKIGEDYMDVFVMYYLNHKDLSEYITGAVVPKLTQAAMVKIPIPAMSIADQQRIVAELDCLNEMIAVKKEQLKEFDKLAQSTFYDMFGKGSWDIRKIKDVATVKIGPFGSALHQSDYISGGTPLVNPVHMVNGAIIADNDFTVSSDKIAELQPYLLKTNDVVFGRRGDIGRCALVTEKENGYLCGTGSMYVRFTIDINPVYSLKILSSEETKKYLLDNAKGATMLNINGGIVENIEIPLPPLSLQQQFADKISAIEAQKELVKQSIAETQHLLDYTMDKYFG